MAKIKTSALIGDIRGKEGGIVFAKNRSGLYSRIKSTPTNPRTSFQQENRALLGAQSSLWSGLTPEQRLSFDLAVDDWKSTNVFGDSVRPTGKSLFVSLTKNLISTDQATITSVPNKTTIPYMGVESVLADVSTSTIIATLANDPTGFVVVVEATKPVSQGTNFYKGKYRRIAVVAGADLATENLFAAYTSRFGALTVGMNVSFQLKIIADNGQMGIAENVKISVVA